MPLLTIGSTGLSGSPVKSLDKTCGFVLLLSSVSSFILMSSHESTSGGVSRIELLFSFSVLLIDGACCIKIHVNIHVHIIISYRFDLATKTCSLSVY